MTSNSRRNSLSARGGGEGWGEVGDSRALADTHLTLPLLRNGPSLSPRRAEREFFGSFQPGQLRQRFELLLVAAGRVQQQMVGPPRGQRLELLRHLLGRAVDAAGVDAG